MNISRKALLLLLGLAVLVMAMAAITYRIVSERSPVSEETREIFSDSPNARTYTDLNGNQLAFEQYLGQVLVVVSWASWSPFSAADLTALNELAKEYVGQPVIFIGMNRKETKEQALRYLATLPELPYLTLVIDTEDKFYKAVSGYAMPETVVFDQDGEIVLHDRGVMKADTLKSVIEQHKGV